MEESNSEYVAANILLMKKALLTSNFLFQPNICRMFHKVEKPIFDIWRLLLQPSSSTGAYSSVGAHQGKCQTNPNCKLFLTNLYTQEKTLKK